MVGHDGLLHGPFTLQRNVRFDLRVGLAVRLQQLDQPHLVACIGIHSFERCFVQQQPPEHGSILDPNDLPRCLRYRGLDRRLGEFRSKRNQLFRSHGSADHGRHYNEYDLDQRQHLCPERLPLYQGRSDVDHRAGYPDQGRQGLQGDLDRFAYRQIGCQWYRLRAHRIYLQRSSWNPYLR